MGETGQVVDKGTPQVDPGQSSATKEGSTSKGPEATYTRVQVEKHTSDALTEQGRKHKEQVSTLQSKLDELSDVKDDRVVLQGRIDELSSKDPEVFNLAKKEAELRDREKQLVKETRSHASRLEKADNLERELNVTKIVDDYEGGDYSKLLNLCTIFKAYSEAEIRGAADTLWTKKFVVPGALTPNAIPPVKPYAGMTSGGDSMPESAQGKIKAGWEEIHK